MMNTHINMAPIQIGIKRPLNGYHQVNNTPVVVTGHRTHPNMFQTIATQNQNAFTIQQQPLQTNVILTNPSSVQGYIQLNNGIQNNANNTYFVVQQPQINTMPAVLATTNTEFLNNIADCNNYKNVPYVQQQVNMMPNFGTANDMKNFNAFAQLLQQQRNTANMTPTPSLGSKSDHNDSLEHELNGFSIQPTGPSKQPIQQQRLSNITPDSSVESKSDGNNSFEQEAMTGLAVPQQVVTTTEVNIAEPQSMLHNTPKSSRSKSSLKRSFHKESKNVFAAPQPQQVFINVAPTLTNSTDSDDQFDVQQEQQKLRQLNVSEKSTFKFNFEKRYEKHSMSHYSRLLGPMKSELDAITHIPIHKNMARFQHSKARTAEEHALRLKNTSEARICRYRRTKILQLLEKKYKQTCGTCELAMRKLSTFQIYADYIIQGSGMPKLNWEREFQKDKERCI